MVAVLYTMDVRGIINEIRDYPGITRKKDIGRVVDILRGMESSPYAQVVTEFGDDAAAIRYRDHYLLLAAEGMWPQFVKNEPYAAGKAAVMASVNDIAAMGGTPLALVNVLSSSPGEECKLIMEGIRKGCEKFRIPMVGGHFNPDAKETSLAVSILGVARALLRSSNAQVGQKIVLAVDLDGSDGQCQSVLSWDATSGKSTAYLLERLGILKHVAEEGICQTAKDVSNGGMLGTIALLCECSKKGAKVLLDTIPVPPGISLIRWLKAFLSYGFILCVDDVYLSACLEVFRRKGIVAEVIGEVQGSPTVDLEYRGRRGTLFNFCEESIIGI